MNRIHRIAVSFDDGGYLALELHGNTFELRPRERALVDKLSDLMRQYRDAQAKVQAKAQTPEAGEPGEPEAEP